MARIIVDCTHTFQTGAGTGIQRVVRKFADALLAIADPPEFEVVPARVAGGRLYPLPRAEGKAAIAPSLMVREGRPATEEQHRLERALLWAARANRVLRSSRVRDWMEAGPNEAGIARWIAGPGQGDAAPGAIEPVAGDVFLSLDSSWVYDIRSVLDTLGRAGATRIVFLHDVLPLTHPQWFTPGTRRWFRGWLDAVVPRVEGVVANSRATCAAFREVATRRGEVPECVAVHLGAEIGEEREGAVRGRLREALGPEAPPAFLTVGTLEPRKNVGYALDIFEALSARGIDCQWHIVGSPGWMAEETARRIRAHPAYGERLHWWVGLTDPELSWCYRHAAALVAVSAAEGFGLPLVEARLKGLPVFASDIPVFREVLGSEGRYLPLASAKLAAAALEDFVAGLPGSRENAPASRIARPWAHAARELADAVLAIDARRRGRA